MSLSSERFLFHCPSHKAEELCKSGAAMVPEADRQEKCYWRILLLRTPLDSYPKLPRPLTIRSYMGQHYTFREHVLQQYYLQQFHPVHPADRWAFLLSVSDCLTSPVSV